MTVRISLISALVASASLSLSVTTHACAPQGERCNKNIPCCDPETLHCNEGTCGGPGLKIKAGDEFAQKLLSLKKSSDLPARQSVSQN